MKKNLLSLLKIFDKYPNRLINFLIKNNAFNDEFLDKVKKSHYLTTYKKSVNQNFFNFEDLINFEESLLLNSNSDYTKEYNNKLKKYIQCENYEEATILKKYMIENNIQININF